MTGCEGRGPYPRPRAPLLPVLSFRAGTPAARVPLPALSAHPQILAVASGRAAIAMALNRLGFAPEDRVLMPAYHCQSMVNAALELGGGVDFYHLNSDLTIDFDDLLERIQPTTRAVLAVHYFGFPFDLAPLADLCRKHGLALIEDCAHALYGDFGGGAPGGSGDFAIGSATKFYPVPDGGYLLDRRSEASAARLRSGGLRHEIKAAFNALDEAAGFNRLWPISLLLHGIGALRHGAINPAPPSGDDAAGTAQPATTDNDSDHFDVRTLDVRMSLASRLIARVASGPKLCGRRQQHFFAYLEAVADLAGCRPVFAELPANVAPYVFPLYVESVEPAFSGLKRSGVPIFRWDCAAKVACPVSSDYATHVFQLPCHQALTNDERDWIVGKLKRVMRD